MDKSSLWRKVLNAKYNMDGRDWIPKMELNRKVSTVWRDIMQIHTRQPLLFDIFMENAKLRVGDGRTIKFWKDICLGNIPLQFLFPTLFRIIINKTESLGEVFTRFEEMQRWVFSFRRSLLDREIEALADLNDLMVVYGVVTTFDRPN